MQIKIILSKQIKVLYNVYCICTYGAAIFFLKFVNASFSVHIAEKSQQCCMVLLGPKIILNLRIKTWVCHGRNRCNGLCLVSNKDRCICSSCDMLSVRQKFRLFSLYSVAMQHFPLVVTYTTLPTDVTTLCSSPTFLSYCLLSWDFWTLHRGWRLESN